MMLRAHCLICRKIPDVRPGDCEHTEAENMQAFLGFLTRCATAPLSGLSGFAALHAEFFPPLPRVRFVKLVDPALVRWLAQYREERVARRATQAKD